MIRSRTRAYAALLSALLLPLSAQGQNTNTTIQEGRVNINRTIQVGDSNQNTTYQSGRVNINRTVQIGASNSNRSAQFGLRNRNTTVQRRGYSRLGLSGNGGKHDKRNRRRAAGGKAGRN